MYGHPTAFSRKIKKNVLLLSWKTVRVVTHNYFSRFHLNMQMVGVKQSGVDALGCVYISFHVTQLQYNQGNPHPASPLTVHSSAHGATYNLLSHWTKSHHAHISLHLEASEVPEVIPSGTGYHDTQ